VANKYKVTKFDSFDFETDEGNYTINTEVDSFGKITIRFGNELTFTFDYSNAEKLQTVLEHAKNTIENAAIDQAGESFGKQQKLEFMDDPTKW